jgi:hypothetical protein
MTGSNGHRIFVALQGNTKILLGEGDAFQVIDANGTDGEASFELPDPDPENDGVSEYSVFARELGKPGGGGSIETCATDPVSGDIVCSIETLTLSRGKGKSTFRNVSRELLYIYYDLDGDGTAERFPLFDDALEGYFWDFDNNGLKVVQLRFYPCTTNVETGETSCF